MTSAALPGDWDQQAACKGLPAAVIDRHFFPGSSGREAPDSAYDYARRRWCDTCPVRDECLSFALDTVQKHGLWGGTSPMQRRKLLAGTRAIPHYRIGERPCEECPARTAYDHDIHTPRRRKTA